MDNNQKTCLLVILAIIILGLIYVTFMVDKKQVEKFSTIASNIATSKANTSNIATSKANTQQTHSSVQRTTQPKSQQLVREEAVISELSEGNGLMEQASMVYNTNNRGGNISIKPVKTIISKIYGKVYNIDAFEGLPTKKFQLKMGGKCLQLNKDGSVKMGICNKGAFNTTWNLVLIDNVRTLMNIVGANLNRGASMQCTNFPFYFCVSSQTPTMCLQYDGSNITVRELGNYENQKWDVGFTTVVDEVEEDGLSSTLGNEIDPNKIKINLRIDDDMINDILSGSHPKLNDIVGGHTKPVNVTTMTTNPFKNRPSFFPKHVQDNIELGNCSSNLIPKKSAGSLCRGCNPDN